MYLFPSAIGVIRLYTANVFIAIFDYSARQPIRRSFLPFTHILFNKRRSIHLARGPYLSFP